MGRLIIPSGRSVLPAWRLPSAAGGVARELKNIGQLGALLFPDLQILARRKGRITYLHVRSGAQILLVGALLLGLLCFSYFGLRLYQLSDGSRGRLAVGRVDRETARLAVELKRLQASLGATEYRAERAGEQNDRLNADLLATRQRLAALGDAHRQDTALPQDSASAPTARQAALMANAARRATALEEARDSLAKARDEIERKLRAAEGTLGLKSAEIAALNAELAKNGNRLAGAHANQTALRSLIPRLEKDLAAAKLASGALHAQLATNQGKLLGIANQLDRLLARRGAMPSSMGNRSAEDRATAAALAKIATAERERTTLSTAAMLPGVTAHRIETLLASTGLDARKLLDNLVGSRPYAEGGPFIPLGDAMSAKARARRQMLVTELTNILPIRAPLVHYRVTSPFGPRTDPINFRPAFHPGIDLAAPFRSPVYSTAAGVVLFAGDDGGYGLVVKMDNGHEIETYYSHLNRIYVERGQQVPAGYPLGEEGSTGRSTGPHVFYEIRVDGTPVNPAKFLGTGGNAARMGSRQ
jgi:murein DD-endopeptidase MepM/ murein hydrolase activator NlpD